MRALVQRTTGKVSIESKTSAGIKTDEFYGIGLVVLLGWMEWDRDLDTIEDWLLVKILGLRIFEDIYGKMNLSLADYAKSKSAASGILWVSQFTLGAELDSGFRPSFTKAMNPSDAGERYKIFCGKVKERSTHKNIFGEFGADMKLNFTNWGPVTILLEK